MAFTSNAANMLLNSFIGKGTSALPTGYNCYMGLGLANSAPTPDGNNFIEPSGGNYARSLIGMANQSGTQVMANPVNASTDNISEIFFPEASANWGTIGYFGLFSSATGGQPYIYGNLQTPVSINTGYVPLFQKRDVNNSTPGAFMMNLQ